jgi:hypothetical protein
MNILEEKRMNGPRPALLTPALIGGAAAGVLSGIPVFQCLCCLWIIGGAVLASYFLSRDAAVPPTSGDGALVGAFSGVFAAVVSAVVSIPFTRIQLAFLKKFFARFMEYIPAASRPEGLDRLLNYEIRSFSFPLFVLNLIILCAVFAALGALGGVIGMSLFGRKAVSPAAPPAPPQPGTPS